MKTKHWENRQVIGFAKEIRKALGNGWDYLVPSAQVAMVDSKVLSVIMQQFNESVPIDAVGELYTRLHEFMGTDHCAYGGSD